MLESNRFQIWSFSRWGNAYLGDMNYDPTQSLEQHLKVARYRMSQDNIRLVDTKDRSLLGLGCKR